MEKREGVDFIWTKKDAQWWVHVAEAVQWCLVGASETPGPQSRERSTTNHSSIRTWLYFGQYEALGASRPFEELRDEPAEILQPPGEALSVKKPPTRSLICSATR